jgi:isopentenyl diphosphate isomerase/L-lactate dehydrogenase-like FMN-dependent dehydrogenase
MVEPATQVSTSVSMLVTVDDYEAAARERLTAMAYDYFRSGADEEHALRRNRDAFARYEIWYRTLVDVSEPKLETTILGTPVAFPILVAPTAYHRLACLEGEPATARAAAAVGTIYCASTLATTTLEEVAAAAPAAPQWFQLYVHKDREFTARLIHRAKAAGYRAIAVTADTPVLGRRCADVRNSFCLPEGMVMENLISALPPDLRNGAGSELARFVASRHDAAFVWSDLDEIVHQAAPLPVVVKGICRPDDALRALDHGAQAVWVSNHGGRQLDLAPATIDVLADVTRAVGDRAEVYVDGGIRNGTHALIALGLGAHAVFVGRPVLWGLAVNGADGVTSILELLRDELKRAMQLAGCPDVAAARDDLIRRR